MKKTIYSALFAMGTLAAQAQTADTVRLGASYVNQVWYSLKNGVVGTPQSRDNWDIAFEINGGQKAGILANTQKANFAIYKAPFSVLQWGDVDTIGIKNWRSLYNSDISWSTGALNQTRNLSDETDFGWGNYDQNSHFVIGDSCYVVKLSATVYKKIMIDALAGGSYNFIYADLNGTNETSASVVKTNYPGKNFGYYNLTSGTALDREPLATDWDLTFVKYTAMYSENNPYYVVTGILQNKNVLAAQADNVTDVASFRDTTGLAFKADINSIGFDWKDIDTETYTYYILPNRVYFVKDKAGKYWKLVFTNFTSSNGQVAFTKEELSFTTALEDESGIEMGKFTVYPNPASGENISLLFDTRTVLNNAQISIADAQGTLVHSETINIASGFRYQELAVRNLKSGVYMVTVNAGGKNHIQKFVKQ